MADIFDQLAAQNSPTTAQPQATAAPAQPVQQTSQPAAQSAAVQPKGDIFDQLAANGGQVPDAAAQQGQAPGWGEDIDRPGYKPGYFETLYGHGIGTIKKLAGQAVNDITETAGLATGDAAAKERDQQLEQAEEAKKIQTYHKIASDFHDAVSQGSISKIIDAAGDFASLFQDPVNKNDVIGSIANSYVTGAKNAYGQAGIHAENIANAVKDAAEKHQAGDDAGALKALQTVPKETQDFVRNGFTFGASVVAPGAAGFASQILNQAVDEWQQGKKAEALADATIAASPKFKEIKNSELGLTAREFGSKLADSAYAQGVSDALSKVGISKPSVPDISGAIGQQVGEALPDIAKGAGKAVGAAAYGVGKVAGKVAVPFAGGVIAGVADSLLDSAKDSFNTLVNHASETGSDVLDAMSDIRQKASDALAEKGITGQAAQNAVSDLMNRIQDEYKYWTDRPASVSGGSQEATPDVSTTLKSWLSDVGSKLTPELPEGATAVSRAAGVVPDIAKIATPGEQVGGGAATLEKFLRTFPSAAKYLAKQDTIGELELPKITQQAIDTITGQHMSSQEALTNYAGEPITAELNGQPISAGDFFDTLIRKGTDDFNKIVSDKNVVKTSEQARALRQGVAQRILENSFDRDGSFDARGFNAILEDAKYKLGPEYNNLNKVGQAMNQLLDNYDIAKKATSAYTGIGAITAGKAIRAGMGAVVGGIQGGPVGFVVGLASEIAAEHLISNVAPEVAARLLMRPGVIGEMNGLLKWYAGVVSKAPENVIQSATPAVKQSSSKITKALQDTMKEVGMRLVYGEKGELGLPGSVDEGLQAKGKVLEMPKPVEPPAAPGHWEDFMHRLVQRGEDWFTDRELRNSAAKRATPLEPAEPGRPTLVKGNRVSSQREAIKKTFTPGGKMNPGEPEPPKPPINILGEKKPGKYDVKTLPGGRAPNYDIVRANDQGIGQSLPPKQEQRVRDIINSFSIDKYPQGGIVFVPPKKYEQIRQQIQNGELFGHRIAQSENSTEHWGQQQGSIVSSKLGDGFTIPQIKRTYINAALLNDDQRLQEVLAHELGHHAAEAQKNPDYSEDAADKYKEAYLKRGQQVQKLWDDAKNLPVSNTSSTFNQMAPLASQPSAPLEPSASLTGIK